MVQAVVQTTVVALQGSPVSAAAPANGQSLTWNGSSWAGAGPFLALTGGILTGGLSVNMANPTLTYRDTATSPTAGGLWRVVVGGGVYVLQANTAAAGDFSTAATTLQISSAGAVTVPGPLTVSAGGFAINVPNGAVSIGGQYAGGSLVLSNSGFAISVANGGASFGGQIDCSVIQINGAGISYPNFGTGSNLVGWAWNGQLIAFVNGANVGAVTLTGSDASLKQNFAALSVDPLAVLDKIQLQQFDWVPEVIGTETYQKPHWTCGFTAQNLQPLIPEAVTPALGSGPLGIDILCMIGYLIGGVQQLSARVGALDGKTA